MLDLTRAEDVFIVLAMLAVVLWIIGMAAIDTWRDHRRDQLSRRALRVLVLLRAGILTTTNPDSGQERIDAYTLKRSGAWKWRVLS